MQKGDGHEDGDQHDGGRDHRETDLTRSPIGGDQARLSVLLHAPMDVFKHHDRIVDHQSDRQHQRQESQDVDGKAERHEHGKGRDQRHRNRDRRDQRGPQAAEKQKDHQGDQADGDAQGLVDLVDGALDEHRAVVALLDRHPGGKERIETGGLRLGGSGHRHGVGGGLLDDPDADHGHGIAPEEGAVLFGSPLDPRDVAKAQQIAVVAARQDEAREILGRVEGAVDPDAELAVDGFDFSRGQFQIFGAQCVLDIRHREMAGGQRPAVEPDAHGEHLIAADLDARDPIEHRELVHQIAAGVIRQFRDAQMVAHQIQPQDDVFVAVDLLDLGRLGLRGQLIQDAGDPVADVVGGAVDVAVDVELHRDHGAAVLTGRLHRADAFDAGDAVLNELGDAAFHHIGRGAWINDLDRDHRRVDVGKFP